MPANADFARFPLTSSYKYGAGDEEFVFSCKGRPFVALISPNIPTPTSSLLDYDLVAKLGLKMSDIQCRKFHFAGHKMRILGRISTAVQCVKDGRINGNFHIKALVVSDLYQLLDTHCVAGTKMKEKLAHQADQQPEDEMDDVDISLSMTSLTSAPSVIPSTPSVTSLTSTSAVTSSSIWTSSLKSPLKSSSAALSPLKSSSAAMSPLTSSSAAMSSSTSSSAVTSTSASTAPPSGSSPPPPCTPPWSPRRAVSPVRLAACELVDDERRWSKLKQKDPEYAWDVLKTAAGISDWPDWDSDDDATEEISLNDDPVVLRGKWLDNLELTRPECLCDCGLPTKDYVCKKSLHSKARKHCKQCCVQGYIRFLNCD